jgi:2',3'-cyclic-nucleotide 2'-phosphodiesterase (5'-nucleotidase family)
MSDHYISTLGYDALAIGNHELYKFVDADYVHRSVEHDRWSVSCAPIGFSALTK